MAKLYIRPFTTDKCSGGLSRIYELFGKKCPFDGFCIDHDMRYYNGSVDFGCTKLYGRRARHAADSILRKKIEKLGYPNFAVLVYYLVRVFGHPIWPFPWRWEYGCKYNWGRYRDE